MLTLTLQDQAHLPKIALPPRPPQLLYLILVQPSPNDILQLLLTDLLQGLLFLGDLMFRLEPSLHPYPHCGVEVDLLCITPHVWPARFRVIDGDECVAPGLEGEGRRIVGDGDDGEGFSG